MMSQRPSLSSKPGGQSARAAPVKARVKARVKAAKENRLRIRCIRAFPLKRMSAGVSPPQPCERLLDSPAIVKSANAGEQRRAAVSAATDRRPLRAHPDIFPDTIAHRKVPRRELFEPTGHRRRKSAPASIFFAASRRPRADFPQLPAEPLVAGPWLHPHADPDRSVDDVEKTRHAPRPRETLGGRRLRAPVSMRRLPDRSRPQETRRFTRIIGPIPKLAIPALRATAAHAAPPSSPSPPPERRRCPCPRSDTRPRPRVPRRQIKTVGDIDQGPDRLGRPAQQF